MKHGLFLKAKLCCSKEVPTSNYHATSMILLIVDFQGNIPLGCKSLEISIGQDSDKMCYDMSRNEVMCHLPVDDT